MIYFVEVAVVEFVVFAFFLTTHATVSSVVARIQLLTMKQIHKQVKEEMFVYSLHLSDCLCRLQSPKAVVSHVENQSCTPACVSINWSAV